MLVLLRLGQLDVVGLHTDGWEMSRVAGRRLNRDQDGTAMMGGVWGITLLGWTCTKNPLLVFPAGTKK